jgi:hypothetical protein
MLDSQDPESIECEYFEEITSKIRAVFSELRDCLDEREKILIANINKIASKNKELRFMNEMIGDLTKIKEKYRSSSGDLDEKILTKIDKKMTNMSNMIDDMNNYKRKIGRNEDYEFLYEENELFDILNKIQGFGEIKKCSDYFFKWRKGPNYTLSCHNLIATKTSGGEEYNCNILGDIILPRNRINKWKIKLKKLTMTSMGDCDNNNFDGDILIGVAPANVDQNEKDLYFKAWTFLCGNSKISIPSGFYKDYIKDNRLKEGDIIEVIMNTINGELSFAINNVNYGVACRIPLNTELSPFVLIYGQEESIELLN